MFQIWLICKEPSNVKPQITDYSRRKVHFLLVTSDLIDSVMKRFSNLNFFVDKSHPLFLELFNP